MPYITYYLLMLTAGLAAGRQCPFNTMCSCKAGDLQDRPNVVTEISCVGVPFAKLPELPHGNMSSISVIGSGLEQLSADSFGDMKTASLSLMSNRLVSVHDHAFMVMYKTLEKLDLSYNNLQNIPIEALLTFQKLKILNLERNEISNLRISWKNIQETLISIYLSWNDLSVLPSDPSFSMSNFRSLIQMYLDGNYLTKIEINALPYTLQVLSISDNLLTEVPFDLMDTLQDLSRLYLKGNYITVIPNVTMTRKKSFLALDLSSNLIKTVNGVFDSSIEVKDLNLQSNYIDTLSPLTFNGLKSNKLDLSNNELSTLPERALNGLEYTLEHLDLSHNKLTKIPKAILSLKNLKFLSLDYNNLPENYPDNFLRNCSQSIRSLSLKGNGITVFPKNIFKQSKRISFLDLGYNRIEEIDQNDFFKWAEHLETLILTQNSINNLKSGTFKNLKKLVELNLSFNNIEKIEDRAFSELGEHIKTLDISFGLKTNHFPDLALKPLSGLIYLALSGNNITYLSKTGIYDLSNLQYFIFDFNRVSEIPENFFHSKVHKFLKDIRFSYNRIYTIEQNTFNGLEELNYIVLNDNQVGHIHQGAFKNLPNILTIILTNNQINKITAMSFVNIPNLISLDLSNNYLVEFSFNAFQNVTNDLQPMSLNLSRNMIENIYAADAMSPMFLKVLDLSYNKLSQVPPNLMISVKDSLRKLDLGFNEIRVLESNEFNNIKGLEILHLNNNGIVSLRSHSFQGLVRLQILDLSNNHLEIFHLGQFKNLESLRILDISNNHLRSLPHDAFHNTKLERLIAHNNIFVLVPSTPFVEVGFTLRAIDFSFNQIEQIGREVFSSMPLVGEVNLCHNRLSHIQSHDLKTLNGLMKLELCGNQLGSVNKELFHHLPNLHVLSLAKTNLTEVPLLHIHQLISLNLSDNSIKTIPGQFLAGLPQLRHLDLSHNHLTVLTGIVWGLAANMKTLHVSNNPIKIFTRDSFSGLLNLHHLNIQNLNHLERFDSDTLSKCQQLRSLKIQTWPKIERYRFQLARITANLRQLKHLSVMILEEKLTDQLHRAYPQKLQSLEITGRNIKELSENSLEGLEFFKEFHLRITKTSIRAFPKKIFWKMRNNRFTLDLTENLLEDTNPEVFYEKGGLRRYGTQLSYAGNINLQRNRIECGCNTMWYSKWMKRYLVETLRINANKPEFNQQLKQDIKHSVCYLRSSEKPTSLLTYEDSALPCIDVLSSSASTFQPSFNRVVLSLFSISFIFLLSKSSLNSFSSGR